MNHISTDQQVSFGSKTEVVESGEKPDTTLKEIDQDLKTLKSKQMEWAQTVPLSKKIALLQKVLNNVYVLRDEWVNADLAARHIPKGHWEEGGSYLSPGAAGHILNTYIQTLKDIEKTGNPHRYSKAVQEGDRVSVSVFPLTFKDSLFLPGVKAELHLQKGSRVEDLSSYQAHPYKDSNYAGGISLVLCAGNVAMLSMNDILHKLITEKKVVAFKVHPVLEYLGSLYAKILEPLITAGYVRIIMGGAKVGHYLTSHSLIDDVHITGSDKTFEAIVYGVGEEGKQNKSKDKRLINKSVCGELGSVSPLIVVPGKWSEAEFEYQAREIVTSLGMLNGYSCCATRVVVLPKNWSGSEILLAKISQIMEKAPAPVNYYPGTKTTIEDAVSCYPDMERHGEYDQSHQPWMMAKNLEAEQDEYAFRREFWATFMSQLFIEGDSPEAYLAKAVKFCNEKLWGTLAATIIIDPKTQKAMEKSGALQKALDDLHYGTVSLNLYPGFGIVIGTPWGGYPGSTYTDIQSGNGYVSNANMFNNVEKSVIYAPFIIKPQPMWFVSQKPNLAAFKAFRDFAITNKLSDFGRLLMALMI